MMGHFKATCCYWQELLVLGTQAIQFTIVNRTLIHEFIVSDLPISTDGLLGNDFLLERQNVLKYHNQDLCLERYLLTYCMEQSPS